MFWWLNGLICCFTKSFRYLKWRYWTAILGGVFPYIIRIHTAYIGKYLQFRYLKCLVIVRVDTQPSSPWLVGWLLPQPIGILYEKEYSFWHGQFSGDMLIFWGIKIKACFSICCFLVGGGGMRTGLKNLYIFVLFFKMWFVSSQHTDFFRCFCQRQWLWFIWTPQSDVKGVMKRCLVFQHPQAPGAMLEVHPFFKNGKLRVLGDDF